jgi:hypothetical protein
MKTNINTNESNITHIKKTGKFKILPKQYRRTVIVNYSRLKEIFFEDERILYFLFVFISLLTIGVTVGSATKLPKITL